jgi:hypothetical protein
MLRLNGQISSKYLNYLNCRLCQEVQRSADDKSDKTIKNRATQSLFIPRDASFCYRHRRIIRIICINFFPRERSYTQ